MEQLMHAHASDGCMAAYSAVGAVALICGVCYAPPSLPSALRQQ
jgi:hypothetical protein